MPSKFPLSPSDKDKTNWVMPDISAIHKNFRKKCPHVRAFSHVCLKLEQHEKRIIFCFTFSFVYKTIMLPQASPHWALFVLILAHIGVRHWGIPYLHISPTYNCTLTNIIYHLASHSIWIIPSVFILFYLFEIIRTNFKLSTKKEFWCTNK